MDLSVNPGEALEPSLDGDQGRAMVPSHPSQGPVGGPVRPAAAEDYGIAGALFPGPGFYWGASYGTA